MALTDKDKAAAPLNRPHWKATRGKTETASAVVKKQSEGSRYLL